MFASLEICSDFLSILFIGNKIPMCLPNMYSCLSIPDYDDYDDYSSVSNRGDQDLPYNTIPRDPLLRGEEEEGPLTIVSSRTSSSSSGLSRRAETERLSGGEDHFLTVEENTVERGTVSKNR